MTPTAHSHRVKHFCSKQQEVGIQGGECADPECHGTKPHSEWCPDYQRAEDLRAKVSALAAEIEVENARTDFPFVTEMSEAYIARRLREILGGRA